MEITALKLEQAICCSKYLFSSLSSFFIAYCLNMIFGCLFDQVLYFDYEKFKGNIFEGLPKLDFRVKDWGPAPRWVAFVDFFLTSRAKYAVVSGAHRRVGTTYAQLIAALAATRNLGTCISPTPCIICCYLFLQTYH